MNIYEIGQDFDITSSLYSRKMINQIKMFGIIMVNHLLMSGKGLA